MASAPKGNQIELHRILAAPPERVYRAFIDPEAMVKWLPPYGFAGKVHEMDARVGGGYKMSFKNFSADSSNSFGGKYLEMKPGERLVYSNKFDDPNLPGEMMNTITFREVACGTELRVIQSGIPEMIPAEMCYLGWQESLMQLAKLVEPEIPDGS